MKKLVLLGLGILMCGCIRAQVVVNLQLPPLGLTIKPQLWNMSLINTGGAAMTVQVQMTMSDAATGQTVLTGNTPSFILQSGVNTITASQVNPVSYTSGAGYNIDAGANGFLPVGVFNICYSITQLANDVTGQIAEECVTAEVEPISPPQLMQPGDSDRVITNRPFFVWLPPTPYNIFSNLAYEMTLVEVQATQSAADAIQQNVPVLLQSNIAFTSLQYPLSMPGLDSSKLYAWRITATNNGVPVANSEIWSFTLEKGGPDTFSTVSKGYYAALRRVQDASYSIATQNLRFVYTHEASDSTVQVTITDISNTAHRQVSLDSPELPVKYGGNYIAIDIGSNSGIIDRHMYLLELVNSRNEHWFLKFEYRKPNAQ
jgi:hypothetical protein